MTDFTLTINFSPFFQQGNGLYEVVDKKPPPPVSIKRASPHKSPSKSTYNPDSAPKHSTVLGFTQSFHEYHEQVDGGRPMRYTDKPKVSRIIIQ